MCECVCKRERERERERESERERVKGRERVCVRGRVPRDLVVVRHDPRPGALYTLNPEPSL